MNKATSESKSLNMTPAVNQTMTHPLWSEIEKVTMEQLQYSRLGVDDGAWKLFAEDGETKMYNREEEISGIAVDPLKAVHTVKGVTGREMAEYFFNPEKRSEWETTIEQLEVIEEITNNTLIILQTCKRIWPASQRDALYWSHVRSVPNDVDPNGQDIWIACNNSTNHRDAPNDGKMVRMGLTVSLVCETLIEPPANGGPITRDHLTCKFTHCSSINIGGWVPTSALRAVYKREYPKFLKSFTNYTIEKCYSNPILF